MGVAVELIPGQSGAPLAGVVGAILDGHLVVRVEPTGAPCVTPGGTVTVRWVEGQGVVEIDGRVPREPAPIGTWRIQATGAYATHRQRRTHVRVPVSLTVKLIAADGSPGRLKGWTVDLSEGGLRLVTLAGKLEPGDSWFVSMDIDDHVVTAPAEVIRSHSDGDGYATVTFRFTGLRPPDVDRIRQYVFATQRRGALAR